jgi:hypothetical protein
VTPPPPPPPQPPAPLPPLRSLALIPCKDLLIAAVWLAGAFRTTIYWRENRLRIGAGSVLTAVDAEAVSSLEALA